MPYIREFKNISQDLMHKVPQCPLCVFMPVTRNDHETSQHITICSFMYIDSENQDKDKKNLTVANNVPLLIVAQFLLF